MTARRSPRIFVLASALLGTVCLGACGGEEEQPPAPGVGRIDLNVNRQGCTAPCPIVRYSYFLTPAGNYTCSLQDGTAAPGREVVIPKVSGDVSVVIVAYCATGDCVRCGGLVDVTMGEDLPPQSVSLFSVPCLKLPLPNLQVTLPLPRCS